MGTNATRWITVMVDGELAAVPVRLVTRGVFAGSYVNKAFGNHFRFKAGETLTAEAAHERAAAGRAVKAAQDSLRGPR